MALVSGDILRFTTVCNIGGTIFRNVDYRRYVDIEGLGNTYDEVASAYRLQFTNDIVSPIFVNALTFDRVEVDNVSNGLDFFIEPSGALGGNLEAAVPNFVALKITQNRVDKTTRNGSKRLSGLPDTAVSNNLHTLSAGLVAAVEAFYGTPMLIGDMTTVNDAELQPVIVGRTLNPTTLQYELDLSRIGEVSSATVGARVTSQVSRKVGVGE